MNPSLLARQVIKSFKPYTPSPTIEELSAQLGIEPKRIVKLDTGENPSVESVVPRIGLDLELSRYPDPSATQLLRSLSTYTGFNSENLICGNGSDELIDLLIRCFVEKGESILICPPTFSMYAFYAQLANAKVVEVLRTESLTVDTQLVLKQVTKKTKIIFIDSPGNPAGTVISSKAVEVLCNCNSIVVIDEAYFEYSKMSVSQLVNKYPNLVILRTLSKWAGLAGLRIGYAIASTEVIQLLSLIKSPYNVNTVAQDVAAKLLQNPKPVLQKIATLIVQRNRVIKAIKKFRTFIGNSIFAVDAHLVFGVRSCKNFVST